MFTPSFEMKSNSSNECAGKYYRLVVDHSLSAADRARGADVPLHVSSPPLSNPARPSPFYPASPESRSRAEDLLGAIWLTSCHHNPRRGALQGQHLQGFSSMAHLSRGRTRRRCRQKRKRRRWRKCRDGGEEGEDKGRGEGEEVEEDEEEDKEMEREECVKRWRSSYGGTMNVVENKNLNLVWTKRGEMHFQEVLTVQRNINTLTELSRKILH